MTTQQLIDHFQLLPHPEGGWYKETYRSAENISSNSLPDRFAGERNMSTAIYFLLEKGNYSAFHRIKSDECWHFYAGQALEIFIIDQQGDFEIVRLGSQIESGECFQYVVPANCWFASRPALGSAYSFVGCTVAPGFDFRDFEMANKEELIASYPVHTKWIEQLCR